MSETDEYGVTKKYDYNTYGDLEKVKLIGTDGKTITLQENTFDSSNEYITRSSSGYDSEEYAYVKPFDALDKTTVNEYNLSNDTYSTTFTTIKYGYDPLGERLMSVSAMDGSHKVATHWIGYNSIGIASASDGISKYYFEGSHATEKYTFGVTEDTAKIKLQTASVSGKTKTNKFYRTNGRITDTVQSEYDKYGRFEREWYNGELKVLVDYESDSKTSGFCAGVSYIWDGYTNHDITYEYENGNLKSWETDGFKVETVNNGKKYTFSDDEMYIVENKYDDEKVTSPRTKEVNAYVHLHDHSTKMGNYSCAYERYTKTGLLEFKSTWRGNYTYSYLTHKNCPLIGSCNFIKKDSNNNVSVESYRIEWDYRYDSLGNIKTVSKYEDGTKTTKSYSYDKFSRLTNEDGKTYLYDEHGRMKRNGSDECKYDARGRLVNFGSTVLTYDNYGNRTRKGEYEVYEWERGNKLKKITLYPHTEIEFTYDYKGIRSTKSISIAGQQEEYTRYYYDGDKLIGEDRSNGIKLRYFYDEQGVCGCKYKDAEKTKYITYIKNIFGDIEYLQNGDGEIYGSYEYDAWGNCTIKSDPYGIANINPFRYRGYYYDADSKLYYLITRYYDPHTANFLSMDSAEYLSPDKVGGVDLYAYCGNNPVMYYDPTGEFVISLFVGLAVSFTIGFAASAISQGIQYGWDNINFLQAGVDGLFALTSTALAATGIGLGFSMLLGGVMGFSQYAIDSVFHGEELTLSGAISSFLVGGIAGAISGSGASNAKVLAKGMTGKAKTGMKAIITTVSRYGKNSVQFKNIMNLYGKIISNAVQNTVNKAFTQSVIKIWVSIVLFPLVSEGIQFGLNKAGIQ